MTRYGFYVNSSGCTGCKACQIACKDKNDLPAGVLWRRVVEISGGQWVQSGLIWLDQTFTYFTSLACMHCEKPICMEVCPAQAITQRKDGIVLINADSCLGCRYCEWACPYAALQFDHVNKVMTKCNLCYDDVDQGKQPACVNACQMRVLDFGDIAELRTQYGELPDIYPLPDADFTQPSITFTAHRDTQTPDATTAHIANREEI